jgi:two-component system, chemotaxis family, CheB/CheR fusion protein
MSVKTANQPGLDALLEYIKQHRGFDFTGYKHASLERRITKRMRTVKIDDYGDYLDFLQVEPNEFIELFNTILINVTRFFRDPDSWEYLAASVLPEILNGAGNDQPVRVWNPGCSSGQETCTIAIVLAEALGMDAYRDRVKIYGTDVDEHALQEARSGLYTASELESVPEEYRARYFLPQGDAFAIHRDLRRNIIFGRHDLVQDAPISRVDLLICRNTLMYFNAKTQSSILTNFHYAMNDGAALFLGNAEMLLTHAAQFAPVELKQRVFQKIPVQNQNSRKPPGLVDEDQVHWLREAAFELNAAAQLVLDQENQVVLVNKRARAQFDINEGDLGRPFQDFQISYDPADLRSMIDTARNERKISRLENVSWVSPSGERSILTIHVAPLFRNGGDTAGMIITIADTSLSQALQTELDALKQDLETTHEELEATVEEVETTNEELQSSNEELETMNEELQSSNEELETMNEELQSTNDELESINDVLRRRTTELNDVNVFLESILTSLRAGVVVVDSDFNVQIWNAQAVELWGLRTDEVVGNHFLNLNIGLPVDQLRGPIQACLNGESDSREIVLRSTNRVGMHIDCSITCVPLTRSDGNVYGTIMLMEASAASQN